MGVVEIHVHARASTKICHAHSPVRWVGCWEREPLGCCGSPSPVVGNSIENINTYLLSEIYARICTLALLFILLVPFSLLAEKSHMKFTKDMNKAPSQQVARHNGNTGYSLPNWASIATGDKYPGGRDGKIRNAIAFQDPTDSRSDGAKAPIAMHIRILVRR